MEKLIEELHRGGWSCVVESKNSEVRTFTRKGIIDLWELMHNENEFLEGAKIADKVVGKAAAAVMVATGVSELYTDVISSGALSLLNERGVRVNYGKEVEYIINRKADGMCPMEQRVKDVSDVSVMISEIEKQLAIRNAALKAEIK